MPCDRPYIFVPAGRVHPVSVPCGRCPPCKMRRVNSWVFRLMQEDKVSTSAHFVTLTYDTSHVPISEHGFMTLRKQDFQLYMKRLRKLSGVVGIKYYAAAEYGSTSYRPHFHAIIFNVPQEKFFIDAWSIDGVPIGSVHVGTVTTDSIAYTMKYIDKPPSRRLYGSRDDRVFEFSLMSKGLGANFLTDEIKAYYKADLSRNYCTKEGGYKIALPQYYSRKIFTESEKEEQLCIIHELVIKDDSLQRLEFDRLRYDPDVFSFEDWRESKRRGRSNEFYHSLKSRNL